MARILSLVTAGLLMYSVGCMGGRWEGEYKPPLPRELALNAYEEVRPTAETPGIEGGRVAIAGGRIDDHGVYIDVLVEAPEDPELDRLIDQIADAGYEGDTPGERWLTLSHGRGEDVRALPRERAWWVGGLGTHCYFGFGRFDRQIAKDGLNRYNIVIWYHTEEQLTPGTYILHVHDIHGANANYYKRKLGLESFDGSEVELRYMKGFEPGAGEG